jgi:molybdate transport system substrate-binding protein
MTQKPAPLRAISSMATRQVLAALSQAWQLQGGMAWQVESVGGVDAARRVQAGEAFDLVFLADDALATLAAAGHVRGDTARGLMRSQVAVAVAAHAPPPDIGSEAALRQAVLAAPSVGYSTGPSGQAVLALLDRWGVRSSLGDRLVQAPPGVPVAQLMAQGQVALGFQQLSELLHVPGIAIVGPLPPEVSIDTVFAGAVASTCTDMDRQTQAQAVLAYLASPAATRAKTEQGMAPLAHSFFVPHPQETS